MDKKKLTLASIATKMILEGKTNAQILAAFVQRLGADPEKHKYIPAWYRSKLVREGMISPHDARKNAHKVKR